MLHYKGAVNNLPPELNKKLFLFVRLYLALEKDIFILLE